MIKMLLSLTLLTVVTHAAEFTNYNLVTSSTENNIDLFDDIINQWDPTTADIISAQSDNENENSISNTTPRSNFYEFCLQPKENNNAPRGYQNTQSYNEISTLVKDLNNKTNGNLVQCFSSWFGIINYIKDTKEAAQFVCPICKKNHSRAPRAASCYVLHWDKNAFTCKQCTTDLKSFDMYQKHKKKCANSVQSVNTTKSTQTPKGNYDHLVDYEKKRLDDALQKIICCGSSLHEWAVAQNHISKYHKHGTKNYMCPDCNSRHDTNARALECFMKNKDNAIFTCLACKLDCKKREKLLEHVKSECTSSEEFSNYLAGLPVQEQVSGQGNSVGNAFKTVVAMNNPDNSHEYGNYCAPQELLPLVDQPTEYQLPSAQEEYQSLDNLSYQVQNSNFYNDPFEQQSFAEQGLFNDDHYMPSSLNNEIVESSISEYHHYYQNQNNQ